MLKAPSVSTFILGNLCYENRFYGRKVTYKTPPIFLPGEGGQSGFGVDRGEWLFESVILLSRVLLKTAAIEKIDLIKDLACPPKPED